MSRTHVANQDDDSDRAPRPAPPPIEYVTPSRLIDLLPGYQSYLVGEKRRAPGIKAYINTLRRFFAWIGDDATMEELDRAACQRYKEHMGAQGSANNTIAKVLAACRDFSIWAVLQGLRYDDPTTGIRRPRRTRPDPHPLYETDVHAMMRAMEPPPDLSPKQHFKWMRNRLAILFYLYTGMRLSELYALTWGRVKLESLLIEIRDGKGGKDRGVPIHPRLALEIAALPIEQRKPSMFVIGHADGRAMSAKSAAHIFDRWLTDRLRAELGDEAFHVHAHQLRHTFASHLVWNDVDLRTLQELLGHAQLSTTEHYVKVDHRRKRVAMDRLPDFGDGKHLV